MGLVRHIPNAITILNLLCGSIACLFALNSEYYSAFIMIVTAAIFDFFDGMSARLLKAYSPMGKELDSLADVISFGLAPTFIIYDFVSSAYSESMFRANMAGESTYLYSMVMTLPFILVACSALRLAKFNVDERQTSNFIGLATPAATLLISGFTASLIQFHTLEAYLKTNAWIIAVGTALIALLLVCNVPMFSFKFKNLKWKDNKIKFIFICYAIAAAAVLLIAGIFSFPFWIFISITGYILLNIAIRLFGRGDTDKQ